MSLILDALKRLERDRATRAKRRVHIASDLLKGREPPGKKNVRFWVGGLAGTVLAVAALALAYVIFFSQEPPVPKPVIPEKIPAATPVGSAAAPSTPARSGSTPPEESSASIGERPVKRALVETRAKASHPSSPLAKKASLRKTPERPSSSDSASLPSLTVSGILWAENRLSRRAMINDAVIAEGGKIDGAEVVEIMEDRVRFSRGGQIFDVYIR